MTFDDTLRDMIREEVQAAVSELAARLVVAFGGARVGPARRGRPPGSTSAKKVGRGRRGKNTGRACAVIGCKRAVRSKGYCAAHYQKQRMLERTNRLPSDWKDDAPPHSVKDIVLPRGRAGAKALAEARKK